MSLVTRTLLLAICAIVALIISGCDRYVEQASLRPDGSIAFLAEADIICSDPLQNAIFDSDPCETAEAIANGEDVGQLPLGIQLDDGFEYEVSGELDRRRILVRWQGPESEFRSLLVSGVAVGVVDEDRTTATFTVDDAAFDRLRNSTEPDVVAALPRARWAFGEFRAIAPAKIVDHNGDRIDGRSVTWEFDDDVPETLTLTWSTAERTFQIWWWIIGAVVLSVVLAMIVLTAGAAEKGKSET